MLTMCDHPVAISFFSTRYDIDTILGFFSLYDTTSIQYDINAISIRCVGLKKDLLFKEFLANFQNFRRFFGIFGVVVVEDFHGFMGFQNFRGIF